MARYAVVRLWLSDRPGSLGQIATKIGEVGGDLVGIDILERDGARAVDELTVELAPDYAPDDLVAVLSQLSGVEVEDVRHLVSRAPYREPRSPRCRRSPRRGKWPDGALERAHPRRVHRVHLRVVHAARRRRRGREHTGAGRKPSQ